MNKLVVLFRRYLWANGSIEFVEFACLFKLFISFIMIIIIHIVLGTLIDGEPIIKLPPKTIELTRVDFTSEERAFYTQLEADSRSQFKVCPFLVFAFQ